MKKTYKENNANCSHEFAFYALTCLCSNAWPKRKHFTCKETKRKKIVKKEKRINEKNKIENKNPKKFLAKETTTIV